MSHTTWKAGDTCTIKPKTPGVPRYKCSDLWTVARVKPNGDVTVHNGVPGDVEGFALTSFVTVFPSRLLPPGDACPTIAAEMGAEVLRLRAENAELLATLANERGEGEAPCEGWVYFARMERWQAPHGVVARLTSGQMANAGWKAPYAWERWDTPEVQRGCADSFRAAMRAASSQGADVPREQ